MFTPCHLATGWLCPSAKGCITPLYGHPLQVQVTAPFSGPSGYANSCCQRQVLHHPLWVSTPSAQRCKLSLFETLLNYPSGHPLCLGP